MNDEEVLPVALSPAPGGTQPRGATGVQAGVVGAGLGLVGALLLLVTGGWAPLLQADDAAVDGLHALAGASPALVGVALVVSTLGTTAAYAVVFGALAVHLTRRGRRADAVFVLVAVAGGRLLNAVAKAAVDRPRPDLPDPVAEAGSSAFPSGHAQGVVVAAGVLLALGVRGRAVVPALVGWVLLMGLSRIVLGLHSPSDVVAGYALGAAWVAGCAAVAARFRREKGR